MICPTCGEEIPEGIRVCPYCEERVGAPDPFVAPPSKRPAQAVSRPAPIPAPAFRPRRGAPVRPSPSRSSVRSVDLDGDRPTIDKALARLAREIARARRDGVALLRVVHGHGTSGGPVATIRQSVRARLHALRREGVVRGFLPGEEFAPGADGTSRAFLRRHPVLESSLPLDRRNRGITFVEL